MKTMNYGIRKKAENALEWFAVSKWKTGTPLYIGFQFFYGPGSLRLGSKTGEKRTDGIPHQFVRAEGGA